MSPTRTALIDLMPGTMYPTWAEIGIRVRVENDRVKVKRRQDVPDLAAEQLAGRVRLGRENPDLEHFVVGASGHGYDPVAF